MGETVSEVLFFVAGFTFVGISAYQAYLTYRMYNALHDIQYHRDELIKCCSYIKRFLEKYQ